jgi:type IV pilus assembly protein PilE
MLSRDASAIKHTDAKEAAIPVGTWRSQTIALEKANMRKATGFSLIELMIVVMIIGILASIAIPNYNEYVTRSKITEAVSVLSNMRVKMEQFFQDNKTYTGACTAGTLAPEPVDTANWDFACLGLSDTGYTIRALGIGSMAGFEYTINQNNQRDTNTVPSGWSTPPPGTHCWVLKRSGGC